MFYSLDDVISDKSRNINILNMPQSILEKFSVFELNPCFLNTRKHNNAMMLQTHFISYLQIQKSRFNK